MAFRFGSKSQRIKMKMKQATQKPIELNNTIIPGPMPQTPSETRAISPLLCG